MNRPSVVNTEASSASKIPKTPHSSLSFVINSSKNTLNKINNFSINLIEYVLIGSNNKEFSKKGEVFCCVK